RAVGRDRSPRAMARALADPAGVAAHVRRGASARRVRPARGRARRAARGGQDPPRHQAVERAGRSRRAGGAPPPPACPPPAAGGAGEDGVVGAPAYMAPEQAGGMPVGPAADLYGVGAVLYEALTGRLPFDGRAIEVLMAKQKITPAAPREHADVAPDLDLLCM